MSPVLDASVFVAAVSPTERHHLRALELFNGPPGHIPFGVPAIFRLEVLAALSRRGEHRELLDTVDALVRGPKFHPYAIDASLLERSVEVASRAKLRAYDAIYVTLALSTHAPLYTLDVELIDRVQEHFPMVRVNA